MEDSGVDRTLSCISIVEIAIKSSLGKLRITEAELQMAIRNLHRRVIPFSALHAYNLFRVSNRSDMLDRILVATALSLGMPIVGGDREFSHYPRLKVVSN